MPNQQFQFEINNTYTRKKISDVLGGDMVSYLPNKDNRVTCCCLKSNLNISDGSAPIILVGDAPKVIRAANILINQNENNIPIFIKESPNNHKYIGRFRVKNYTENRAEIIALSNEIGRRDLSVMAIFMERV